MVYRLYQSRQLFQNIFKTVGYTSYIYIYMVDLLLYCLNLLRATNDRDLWWGHDRQRPQGIQYINKNTFLHQTDSAILIQKSKVHFQLSPHLNIKLMLRLTCTIILNIRNGIERMQIWNWILRWTRSYVTVFHAWIQSSYHLNV